MLRDHLKAKDMLSGLARVRHAVAVLLLATSVQSFVAVPIVGQPQATHIAFPHSHNAHRLTMLALPQEETSTALASFASVLAKSDADNMLSDFLISFPLGFAAFTVAFFILDSLRSLWQRTRGRNRL